MPDKECLDDKASEALMKLYENGTFLIGEVGGESEPMLAKLSAASLPGIPMLSTHYRWYVVLSFVSFSF